MKKIVESTAFDTINKRMQIERDNSYDEDLEDISDDCEELFLEVFPQSELEAVCRWNSRAKVFGSFQKSEDVKIQNVFPKVAELISIKNVFNAGKVTYF